MYQCARCGYLSNRKGNLINHLKRKRICEPILLDVSPCELLNELKFDNRRNPRNSSVKGIQDVSNKYPVSIQKVSKKTRSNTFSCSFCNKTFKHKNNMYRHEKHRCKLNPSNNSDKLENIKLKQIILELKSQLDEIQKNQQNISTTTNSHNTTNTNSFNTVNVKLNTLGNENIEYLKTFLLENINNIIQCKTDFFVEYVKQKHFHPEHIENHNVVLFNQRSNSMYGYMKLETTLERRLKNSMSLLLYRNIINDVNGFLDKQLQREPIKHKKRAILNRASDSMTNQEDAINDYEHKDDEMTHESIECKKNIRKVDTHIKEIENTIYNQSKSVYGDISSYYMKHNENNE